MAEIAFIAPYEDLAHVARQVSQELGMDVEIHVARMQEGVRVAREAAQRGCQVLVSRGVTAYLIQQSGLDLPVVDVPIGGYDILRAYYQAKQFGGPIGIVDIPDVIQGLESLENILGETFIKYSLKDQDEDIRRGILAVREAGAEVIIGKIAMAREARNFGLNSVIITSGKEAVYQALKEAQRVLVVRHQEKRRSEQLKAILDFAYDGIIALDEEGCITVFNPVAEKLSGWRAEEALGRHVTEVIPAARCHLLLESGKPELGEILEIGNTRVVANRVPIVVDGRTVGVVTTFQNIASLQSLEHKVRRMLAGRGHVAKYTFGDILGESPAFKEAIRLAREYASTQSTVLIYGETGTGKEMFAHAIHLAGSRRAGPFVAVNCAALPENLLESELFGYVEGAFTGARRGGKPGLFELAHKGTIFLDEIGEMSPRLQARVLRVLEEREVMRLGDDRVIPVDVRVIAATHRDLKTMVKNGAFRADLYYRINVLNLTLPPLRERGTDVVLLARHFLQEFCRGLRRPAALLSPEACRELLLYPWSGNVRELRNVMERLALRHHGGTIGPREVRLALERETPGEKGHTGEEASKESAARPAWVSEVNRLERTVIERTLMETGGNKAEAARRLGISRTTLWRKLKRI
ncbi:MAG: sigma 54-interacting transcriptional regulator [Thermoanaerobacteraceae bacterium]|nr:sigma 54-interacting transcriptional regulator [Thermoanaerobacteraceae bacterium]